MSMLMLLKNWKILFFVTKKFLMLESKFIEKSASLNKMMLDGSRKA
jgi:hypothetical protein